MERIFLSFAPLEFQRLQFGVSAHMSGTSAESLTQMKMVAGKIHVTALVVKCGIKKKKKKKVKFKNFWLWSWTVQSEKIKCMLEVC